MLRAALSSPMTNSWLAPALRLVAIPDRLDDISCRDAEEVTALERLLSQASVDRIWSAVERLYETGTQPAISLCLLHHGQLAIHRSIGHRRGNGPGDMRDELPVLATPHTPFCVFSISKAITAMLIHHLDGTNALRLDDPVAEYIPEFGRNGKSRITLRHVLTHRAGIPSVAGNNDPNLLLDWDRIIALLCEAKPLWEAGRRLGYHAITGGYVLGEVVKRATGKSLQEHLNEIVRKPLGFEWFTYGVDPSKIGEVARNYATGLPVPPVAAQVVKRALGVSFDTAVQVSNDQRFMTSVVPSGNLVANAKELATFFQVLLNGGRYNEKEIFDRRVVQRAMTESSYLEADLTLMWPVRYGQGFMLGANRFSMFGPNTPQAFGHYGFINMIGWTDPQRHLAVALLTSGKPFLGSHLRRLWQLLACIAEECQGL